MFEIAIAVSSPVVGPDQSHQECTCKAIVVTVPEGALHLFAERVEELEAIGWGILAAAERIKQQPAPASAS